MEFNFEENFNTNERRSGSECIIHKTLLQVSKTGSLRQTPGKPYQMRSWADDKKMQEMDWLPYDHFIIAISSQGSGNIFMTPGLFGKFKQNFNYCV